METMRKIPAAALHFDASTTEFAAAADGLRKFSGVAYAGGVITGHFYWGRVAFDLATTRFAERVPILIEHDRSQRAGFGQLSADAATGDLRITGTLLGNAHGQAIATEADAGFPWQLSVHIEPGSIEEIGEGFTTTINGRAVTGPLTVFRNSLIRETSFTPTGADSLTHARVFASGVLSLVSVAARNAVGQVVDDTKRVADQEMRSCRNRLAGTSPEPLAGFLFPRPSAKQPVRQPDAVGAFRDSVRQRLTMVQNSAAVISAS